MHLPIDKLVVIMVLATAGASAVWLARRHSTGEIPKSMGLPGTMIEFLGFWVGICFWLWSFTFEGRTMHWKLLGIGIASAFGGRAIVHILSRKASLAKPR